MRLFSVLKKRTARCTPLAKRCRTPFFFDSNKQHAIISASVKENKKRNKNPRDLFLLKNKVFH